MKEEKPKGDFQIQEERRLFYVALTRARQQLTLSTIVNKRKKPSPFLDDFLMDAKIQKFDAVQSAPKVQRAAARRKSPAPRRTRADPRAAFRSRAEKTRGLFARRAVGEGVSPAASRAAATERFGHRRLRTLPDEISCSSTCGTFAAAPHRR